MLEGRPSGKTDLLFVGKGLAGVFARLHKRIRVMRLKLLRFKIP